MHMQLPPMSLTRSTGLASPVSDDLQLKPANGYQSIGEVRRHGQLPPKHASRCGVSEGITMVEVLIRQAGVKTAAV